MLETLLFTGGKYKLIAGNPGAEFYGEVPVSELINGTDLASQIGLTAGTVQHTTEPWLKFNLDGKTLYVAKRPFRHSVSWGQLNAAGIIYGGKVITIRGEQYRVRLLKGANTDPAVSGSGHDPEQSWGSEWNRLFYPLVPNPTNTPTHPISQEGIRYGARANYTEADLGVGSGNGRVNWCQETIGNNRVIRGDIGLSYFNYFTYSVTSSYYGWRPVLELVS